MLRKAGSRANARLKDALARMQANESTEFYAATLSALRNFVSDKLALSPADITKEKISTLFAERGVPADIASRYSDVVANCELHIYGVSTVSADEMRNTYNEAEDIIAKLNPLLKKKKR